jgi:hypothetical protein
MNLLATEESVHEGIRKGSMRYANILMASLKHHGSLCVIEIGQTPPSRVISYKNARKKINAE